MAAFVFFGSLYRSYLSNKKKIKAGIEFVGWCMINTVRKNNIPICNIERGMAKLPLWQHLAWPSS